jgi:hypothetical protein
MSQQYFTDEEWTMLMKAPVQAITAVVLSDKTDPVSFLREVRGAVELMMTEQLRTDLSTDLGRSLMASIKEKMAAEPVQGEELLRKKMYEYLETLQVMNSASDGRKAAIAYLDQVSAILASKVTIVQAEEFKNWVAGLARQVAELVKEEGFMGIGGERVSRREDSALAAIERALDVKS